MELRGLRDDVYRRPLATALDAAREKGVWGIGVDADQGFLGPYILTSAEKRVDTAVFDAIRDAAIGLREAIELQDWRGVALCLSAEWHARKRLAPGVTTREIDAFIERARFAGALAAKVCGAGGGGCLVCLTDPDRRSAVATALANGGATVLPFQIERTGLEVRRS